MYATPPANCYYHASRPADACCAACGRPVCRGCAQADQAGRPLCRPCCLQYGVRQRRSGAVTTLAVLNIVFGAIGILSPCSTAWLFLMPPSMMQGDMKIMMSLPAYRTILLVNGAASLLFGVLLATCGIGLLKLKEWARVGARVYAVAALVAMMASTIVQFGVMLPEFEKAGVSALQITVLKTAVIFGVPLGAAYPIILLVIFSRPMIKVQFGHQLPSAPPGGMPMPHDSFEQ